MKTRMEQFPATNPNPVLSVGKGGTVFYSNVASEPLLHEWGVVVGEKLPAYIRDFVQRVISRNSPEEMEVKAGNKVYLVTFHPLSEEERVDIYGFDISDQKGLEGKLRESEGRLSFALETSHTGAWDLDLVNHTASRSLEHDRIFGYEQLLPQWTYEMFLDHVLPEDRAMVDAKFSKATTTGSDWSFECRIRRVDGVVRWIWAAGRHQLDATRSVRRMAGIVQDITERKHAEEKFRLSEQHYRLLFETMHQGVVYQDAEGNIISMNPAAEKILGKTATEFLDTSSVGEEHHTIREDGSPFPGMEHPAMVSLRTGQEVQNVVVGVYNPLEHCYRWININAMPIIRPGEDKPFQVYTLFNDITERRRIEALREAIHSFGQIIHSTLDFDELMKKSLLEASKAVECETSVISLKKGDHWIVSYAHGFPEDVVGAEMNDDEKQHAVLAIRTKKPVAINDAFNDERVNCNHMKKWGVRSVLVVPLITRDKVVGVIFFNYHKSTFAFDDIYIDFATQLASSMSLALENSRLFENLNIELTERKQVEKELCASEAKYRDVFETVQEVFYLDRLIYDEEGNVIDWIFEDLNPAGFELLGLKNIDDAKEKRGSEVLGHEVASFYLPMIEKARRSSKAVKFQYHSLYVDKEFLTSYIVRGDRLISAQMDVTELKKAEEALRQSEDQFKTLVKNVKSGIALIDEDGRFTVVNPSFLQIFGLDNELSILNVNSQDWSQWKVYGEDGKLLHVDDHPVRKAAMTGKPVKDQLIALLNPGANEFTWLLVSAEPILKENGQIYKTICTYHDITDRKKAGEALQKSEEQYRTLFNTMNEGFCIVEMLFDEHEKAIDYTYIEANLAFDNQTVLKNVIGKRMRELAPNHEEYWFEIYGKVALTGESVQFEHLAEALGRWYEVYAYRVGQPEDRKVAVIFNDITERKQAEMKLQESEARFKNLFEVISSGVAIYDIVDDGRDFIFKAMNPAGELIDHVRQEDIIGKSLYELFPNVGEMGLDAALGAYGKPDNRNFFP
jgi:PAS domain S-box-containing protein